MVLRKKLKKNLFYPSFSWFQEKEAKRRKNLAGLMLVQTLSNGENRSPRIFHFAKNSRNHAIGHGVQTLYVALTLRAGASKATDLSTRGTLPASRHDCGACPSSHATLGPRTESEVADRAEVYFEQPACSKAALPLVQVRTRR